MQFQINFQEGIMVFSITGDVDVYTIQKIRESFKTTLEKRIKHVVIDLSKLDYLDSSGMGFLVWLDQELRKKSGCVGFAVAEGNLLDIIKKTFLDRVLNFQPAILLALDYVKKSKGFLSSS